MSTDQRRADDGFTLVELLVVIVLLGILAAVAMPNYLRQRERAHVAAVRTDARALAIAQEVWSSTAGTYTDEVAQLASKGFRRSGSTTDVRVSVYSTETGRAFCVLARHAPSGRAAWYASGSATGGPVGAVTETRPDTVNCPA